MPRFALRVGFVCKKEAPGHACAEPGSPRLWGRWHGPLLYRASSTDSAREPRFLAILGDGEAGITSIGQAPGFSAEQLIALRGVCHA